MTSPQRRTSPSPASAAEPDSHSFAEEQRRNGAAADGLVPRRQLSRYSSSGSLNAPVAGSNAFRDPGHISIPEKAEDTHKPYTYDSFEQPAASDHNASKSCTRGVPKQTTHFCAHAFLTHAGPAMSLIARWRNGNEPVLFWFCLVLVLFGFGYVSLTLCQQAPAPVSASV